jgi:feruloyl-CoA synthase
VLIDWLPRSHTFGGNNDFNLVVANGCPYFIDEGRPLPAAIDATARNLREISPTLYYNVPRGFEILLPHLEADRELRRRLFAWLRRFATRRRRSRLVSGNLRVARA